jgi:hypothetical protein
MKDEAKQMKRLWDEIHAPREPDFNRILYTTDEMSAEEAHAYEDSFGSLTEFREELQEDRERLRLARRIARIAAWKEPLRDFVEQMRAEIDNIMKAAAWMVQQSEIQPALSGGRGGFLSVPKNEVATDDARFVMRITPEREQRRVRVLVEIKDVSLDNTRICLSWTPEGYSQSVVLRRPNEHATIVKAEFFLTSEEAISAKDFGIEINLVNS